MSTPLYDSLRARLGDPLTSEAAAAQADVPDSQDYLLHLLHYYGPSTDEKLHDAAVQERSHFPQVKRWSDSRLRTARKELVAQGLVEDSGEVSPTWSGREAIVWRLSAVASARIEAAA